MFSTEQQGIRASLLARGRGQPEKDQRSGHAAAADDRKISSFGTPPQSSIVLPSESTERQSSPTSQLVPVGDSAQPGAEKVIIVTPAENLAKSEDAGDSQRRGTDRNDGWTQRPGGGQSGEDEELRTPLLRRRRVRYMWNLAMLHFLLNVTSSLFRGGSQALSKVDRLKVCLPFDGHKFVVNTK